MNKVIPPEFIEYTREQVDGIIADLQKGQNPLTTEYLALTLFDRRDLTEVEHRQTLSVMAAILLQRVAYS